jgi:nitrile hydratase accessory protein
MNEPSMQASAEMLSVLPQLPRGADGPVFKAPWEAQAFAMTLALHERGLFTWKEWAGALADAIRNAQAAGDPDTGESYYHHWLQALETITVTKSMVSETALARRKNEWEHAALHTPHGMPIEL